MVCLLPECVCSKSDVNGMSTQEVCWACIHRFYNLHHTVHSVHVLHRPSARVQLPSLSEIFRYYWGQLSFPSKWKVNCRELSNSIATYEKLVNWKLFCVSTVLWDQLICLLLRSKFPSVQEYSVSFSGAKVIPNTTFMKPSAFLLGNSYSSSALYIMFLT